MNQICATSKNALFRAIEHELFIVQFALLHDRANVFDGRPWTFDQNLVLLSEIKGDVQPSEISLNDNPFRSRIYNIVL